MSSGRPPTLWWDLILAASLVPDSMMSGYRVPCDQEADLAEIGGRLLEHPDEGLPDDLALALRVDDVVEGGQKTVGRLDVHQVHVELLAKGGLDLLGLAGAQEAGVDEDAGQLVAHRLVDQRRGHRGVDPARQTADDPLGSDLGLDGRHRRLDDRRHGPRRAAPADVVEERLQHGLAAVGVHDLGMELHAVDRPRRGPPGRPPGSRRSWRWPGIRAAESTMASKWLIHTSNSGGTLPNRTDGAGPWDVRVSAVRPYSPRPVLLTSPAELAGDELGAVADAEHRHPDVVDGGIEHAVHPRR